MNEDKKYELIGVFAAILLLIIAVSAAAERDNLKQQAVDRGFEGCTQTAHRRG